MYGMTFGANTFIQTYTARQNIWNVNIITDSNYKQPVTTVLVHKIAPHTQSSKFWWGKIYKAFGWNLPTQFVEELLCLPVRSAEMCVIWCKSQLSFWQELFSPLSLLQLKEMSLEAAQWKCFGAPRLQPIQITFDFNWSVSNCCFITLSCKSFALQDDHFSTAKICCLQCYRTWSILTWYCLGFHKKYNSCFFFWSAVLLFLHFIARWLLNVYHQHKIIVSLNWAPSCVLVVEARRSFTKCDALA